MLNAQELLGLPWQHVKTLLEADHVPYKVTIGANFNKFFPISDEGWYVAKALPKEGAWHILIYRPMVYSDFESFSEVTYAETIFTAQEGY